MTGHAMPGQNEALGRESMSISMSCGERQGEDKAAANLPTSIRPSEQSGYISEEEEAEKARIVCTWRRIG